jgi:hypothetical protein
MEAFAKALSEHPAISKVVILKMPVDIRPALSFTDETGVTDETTRNKKEYNLYEILISLRSEENQHE